MIKYIILIIVFLVVAVLLAMIIGSPDDSDIIVGIFIIIMIALYAVFKIADEKTLTHIQEKYGTTYASNEYGSYLELARSDEYEYDSDVKALYDAGYCVPIKSNIYPEAELYVVANNILEEATYRDNFLAYVYHDEARQKIEDAISTVYSDFWMDFPVPSAVFDLDPETTGVKEYLSEDDADLKITLLAYDQEANDKNLDALVESFKKNGIAVECTVVFTSREQGEAAASEDALQTYMSKTGWYDGIAEFSLLSNGQLEYKKWRK